MQLINTQYRGDTSDSLSNIMNVQYGPQAQLGKFTGDMAIAGIQGMGATQRTAMQIASQEGMAQRALKQRDMEFSLTHALNVGNQELARDQQGFNQLKDIETFKQTGLRDKNNASYQNALGDAAVTNANANKNNSNTTAYSVFSAPQAEADRKAKERALAAGAGWETLLTEHDAHVKTLDPNEVGYENKINQLAEWRKKMLGWSTHTNSANLLDAWQKSRLSNIGIRQLYNLRDPNESKSF